MKDTVTLTGLYRGTGRGFGFLIPDDRTEDRFVPPHREKGAWDGDRVEAVLEEDELEPGRMTARVVKILERGNLRVTGVSQRVDHQLWLRPDNERLPGPIKITSREKGKALPSGERCAVEVTSYGTDFTPPLGSLVTTFGPLTSRQAAVEAILFQNGIDREFPQEVREEAEAAPLEVPVQGRLDLRDRLIITIDGAASKDLDDAVSLERQGENWVLGVHIADVSHYVTPGSALDREAYRRGTSVYFADQVVPMLPVALSNGICSLNPQEDRLTLSCIMTLNRDGQPVDHLLAESVIRTTERMTYEDCNRLLAGDSPFLEKKYAHVLPMLRDMAGLSQVLEKNRRLRGSVDLDTQESHILCDSQGDPVEILPRTQGESERLIESFMLQANETVAQHLFEAQTPCVYRVHEKPSQEKTDALREMLSPLGYALRDAGGHSLQKVLDAARGRPEAPAVAMMVLRSMMKARYDHENLGHFGIAAPFYCHFTSPIRRYPDLLVHRCVKALLHGQKGSKALAAACEEGAEQSSRREVAAQTAERDIEKLYLAAYMVNHIGEEFPAAVSGVTRLGLFCALENGVEGFLPVETLPEDRYTWDEKRLTLAGESRVYSFGMALTVVCVAADPITGRVEFRLPGHEEDQVPERPAPKVREKKPLPGKKKDRRAVHVPKRRRR